MRVAAIPEIALDESPDASARRTDLGIRPDNQAFYFRIDRAVLDAMVKVEGGNRAAVDHR
ncbi:hypothetical protein D3C81_1818640 [compost metagenome]